MSEQEVPPGPWRWEHVVPQGPDGFPPKTEKLGLALVAADGTWVVSPETGYGVLEVDAAARELLAKAHLVARLPELFELWESFYDSEGPVQQAAALLEFANRFTHLRWDFDGDLDDDAGVDPL